MSDVEWQLQAVHEQFDVLDSLTSPHVQLKRWDKSSFMCILSHEVSRIMQNHLKMGKEKIGDEISAIKKIEQLTRIVEIDEIRFFYVVIVTDIMFKGKPCKMPVIGISDWFSGETIYLDMYLKSFNSWDEFLDRNDFPPCEYCFPVDGQNYFGRKLKVDFGSSPAKKVAEKICRSDNILSKTLVVCAPVVLLVGSYFFNIPESVLSVARQLLPIAEKYSRDLAKYAKILIFEALPIVSKLKSGKGKGALIDVLSLLMKINREFNEDISLVLGKVKEKLFDVYIWIKKKLSFIFETASEWAQHTFIAVTSRVDVEIRDLESLAKDILGASQQHNNKLLANSVQKSIHSQIDIESSEAYSNRIFGNSKVHRALQHNIKIDNNETSHPVSKVLLQISASLAEKCNVMTLKGVQDRFEAISTILKEIYTEKINTYSQNLNAAIAGSGGQSFDAKVFNQKLGIRGNPAEHYWSEAFADLKKPCFSSLVSLEIKNVEEHKEVQIHPVCKLREDEAPGTYRLVGIHGAGVLSTDELIKTLRSQKLLLNRIISVNEMGLLTSIMTEDLIFGVIQDQNKENTSLGLVLVMDFSREYEGLK